MSLASRMAKWLKGQDVGLSQDVIIPQLLRPSRPQRKRGHVKGSEPCDCPEG